MQEIIATVGLPASGKTTWAVEWIKNHPDYINVNRDDIRLMMQGRDRYNKFSGWREQIVTDIQIEMVESSIRNGKSVIVSDTNLGKGALDRWKAMAKKLNVNYREELFTDVHLGVCLERDARREFPVGQRVIEGMFNKNRGKFFPEAPVHDPNLPDAYIFDVDGTLAQMNGRSPYEWMKVDTDLPRPNVIRIAHDLMMMGYHIIFASGRDGVCKELTEQWLDAQGLGNYREFFIRPEGDNRKDTLIKEEIYFKHIKGRYNVLGVFDDRDQVVHMWRHYGLDVFQVNYGNF